ncbi:hypothetical protein QCA50_003222 [Cerrena zonata]|uniref:BTB domain-containing protein n=1 Tax=Cerrena zonata TaxID=2478898 RepID=A0AAW0GJW3_9APHY
MFTQSSTSSAASAPSSTHSSRSPSPNQFQDARSSSPSPAPSPFYTPSGSPPPQSEQRHRTDPQLPSSILESPPLDSRPYIPHAVGLGIAAPRPIFGPFSPFHKEHVAQVQAGASPIRMPSNPFDSPSLIAANSHSTGSYFDRREHYTNESPLPSPPISADMQTPLAPSDSDSVPNPASNPPASPQSPSLQRSPSPPSSSVLDGVLTPGEPSHTFGTDISNNGRRLSIDLETITNVTQPEALAGPANSLTPSNPLAVNPLDEATSSTSLVTASDDPSQLVMAEIDADGLSTLEKIYLFAKSRLGFHRVYIAKSLAGFLQAGSDTEGVSYTQEEGAPNPDQISTEDAVEYILPLLNGLAMDDDEAVKEALAGELVSIIWWYITRCKLVEDDLVPPIVDEGAEDVHLEQGTDILHHPHHTDQSSPNHDYRASPQDHRIGLRRRRRFLIPILFIW